VLMLLLGLLPPPQATMAAAIRTVAITARPIGK